MTESKVIEIRDRATCMVALATAITAVHPPFKNDRPNRLLRKAGYAPNERYILLTKINGGEPMEGHIDPFEWRWPTTMRPVHRHLQNEWESIRDGDVIDASFLRGERDTPMESDLDWTPEAST